jgi:uncharacterized protein YjeT (DUF2065 family)
MAADDLTAYKLRKQIADLEAENKRYRKQQSLARKFELRLTGAILLVMGAVISVIAYRSFNISSSANVLMMVGVGALFVGAVTMFLNTESFINARLAQDLSLSSIIVVDDLLRDLRVKNKGVYLPSSTTGDQIKVFIPLRHDFAIPSKANLAEDKAFIIGLPNVAQEGVLLKPLGYHLFRYARQDLEANWLETAHIAGVEAGAQTAEPELAGTFSDRLQELLVKGLELADKVTVSFSANEIRVRLHNTGYIGMCREIVEKAPQVCEQIGCPLCSLIACIYTELIGAPIALEDARHDKQDITVYCKRWHDSS